MADLVTVDNGGLTDYTVLTDEVVDATLGTGQKQLVSLVDGTIGSTTKIASGGGVEAGALRVTVASDSTGVLSVDDNGGSLTVDNSVLAVVGGGTEATAQRVTIASDSTGVLSVDDNGGSLTVDGTVSVSGTVTVDSELPAAAALADNAANPTAPAVGAFGMVWDGATWDRLTQPLTDAQLRASAVPVSLASLPALAAGNNNIGDVDIASIAAGDNNIGNVDVVTLPALPAGTNNIGDVDVLSLPATPAGSNLIGKVNIDPRTSGGLDVFRTLDADETEEEVKATAGQVYGWYIYNDGAAKVYVKLYDATAASVTVGTTTPKMTIPIPAGSAANVEFTNGIAFATAICIAATTGVADADVAAPAANQVVANILYK